MATWTAVTKQSGGNDLTGCVDLLNIQTRGRFALEGSIDGDDGVQEDAEYTVDEMVQNLDTRGHLAAYIASGEDSPWTSKSKVSTTWSDVGHTGYAGAGLAGVGLAGGEHCGRCQRRGGSGRRGGEKAASRESIAVLG